MERPSKVGVLRGTALLAARRLGETNVVSFERSVHDGRPHQRICCLAVVLRCRSLWTTLSVCAVEIGSAEHRAAG